MIGKNSIFPALVVAVVLAGCGGAERTAIQIDRLMYNNLATVTISGPNLDKGITVVAPQCTGIVEVAGGTATQRTYTCTPSTVGSMTLAVTGGGATLHSTTFYIPQPHVSLKTTMGDILIELDPTGAPISVKNFLKYVNSGFYTNLIFHRVIASFVIQAGGFDVDLVAKTPEAPIKLEVGNGLSNLRGTVAMARSGELNSATSQFYINSVDNVSLDTLGGGYAVFGKVVVGLDIVDAISGVVTGTTNSMPDVPIVPVFITSISQTQ
jgi:cyclophilin family peptidyl-prolyl cis-trans isomerase